MIKKQKTTNIKGLEQLYGLDQQPIQEAKLVNTSFNAYVTEISNGNQKLSLANEKFVILTQNHINALISEVNRTWVGILMPGKNFLFSRDFALWAIFSGNAPQRVTGYF